MNNGDPRNWAETPGRFARAILSLLVGWNAYVLLILVALPRCRRLWMGGEFPEALHQAIRLGLRGIAAAGSLVWWAQGVFLVVVLWAPRHWLLWRWPVATACGAAGGILANVLISWGHGQPLLTPVAVFTVWTGAATCLAAAFAERVGRRGPD